jgi:hypothetical protein
MAMTPKIYMGSWCFTFGFERPASLETVIKVLSALDLTGSQSERGSPIIMLPLKSFLTRNREMAWLGSSIVTTWKLLDTRQIRIACLGLQVMRHF